MQSATHIVATEGNFVLAQPLAHVRFLALREGVREILATQVACERQHIIGFQNAHPFGSGVRNLGKSIAARTPDRCVDVPVLGTQELFNF